MSFMCSCEDLVQWSSDTDQEILVLSIDILLFPLVVSFCPSLEPHVRPEMIVPCVVSIQFKMHAKYGFTKAEVVLLVEVVMPLSLSFFSSYSSLLLSLNQTWKESSAMFI
ncbi:hypothetical protein OPV22_004741 [Ensete ventricosum]|uniref:Uncharacterized protein n=1 Tax=Ensete ventricosum TaxID=4639 RepID=A0AAV8RMK8_ENSVE|nr:hypothetical protein OPV22_004741 [Ensete ventricosum]